MPSEFTLRTAEESDQQEILNLLNNVFSEQQRSNVKRSAEYWQWKCQQNPFGKSILSVIEIDGKIIGFDHLWRWEIRCRNEILKAVQPCDSAVDPDYTGRGYFRQLRTFGLNCAKEDGVRFSFNFPNKNSLPLNRSLGNIVYGSLQWRVKILKPLSVGKSLFTEKQVNPITVQDPWVIDSDLMDEIVAGTDKFDKFLSINRKKGFHKWRYIDRPTRQYGMVTFIHKSKRGAAVFTVNQKGHLKEMVVVDLLGELSVFSLVMLKLEQAAKKMGCGYIALMENQRFDTKSLWRRGYIKKRLKNMVVLPFDPQLEYVLRSVNNWSIVAGMHDSI